MLYFHNIKNDILRSITLYCMENSFPDCPGFLPYYNGFLCEYQPYDNSDCNVSQVPDFKCTALSLMSCFPFFLGYLQ